jgi:hypothetical protein
MRNERDYSYIAASVIASEEAPQLALLFGLLCGEYLKCPDALFWDVCVKYLQQRSAVSLIRT